MTESNATRCTAFDYAAGIDRAAEIVTEGTAMFTPDELAGHYAFQAAKESGYADSENFEAHLEILADAGGTFDSAKALAVAEALAA